MYTVYTRKCVEMITAGVHTKGMIRYRGEGNLMHIKGSLCVVLIASIFILPACYYESGHYDPVYDTGYIDADEHIFIGYELSPQSTYRVELKTFFGDADLIIYDAQGDVLVSSSEFGHVIDEVIFTVDDFNYEIEVHGQLRSEYQLFIEQLHSDSIGLSTDYDGVEFNISIASFTGEIFSILDSIPIQVSHAYDFLIIRPVADPIWLDITPTGTLNDNSATLFINILETEFPSANNFATLLLQAKDVEGKVDVYKEVDIIYRVTN